jgi:hypothetical protein
MPKASKASVLLDLPRVLAKPRVRLEDTPLLGKIYEGQQQGLTLREISEQSWPRVKTPPLSEVHRVVNEWLEGR